MCQSNTMASDVASELFTYTYPRLFKKQTLISKTYILFYFFDTRRFVRSTVIPCQFISISKYYITAEVQHKQLNILPASARSVSRCRGSGTRGRSGGGTRSPAGGWGSRAAAPA